jgi:hypothetical protein
MSYGESFMILHLKSHPKVELVNRPGNGMAELLQMGKQEDLKRMFGLFTREHVQLKVRRIMNDGHWEHLQITQLGVDPKFCCPIFGLQWFSINLPTIVLRQNLAMYRSSL